MKWIYGKQDFKTLERGQENCYLMTNGLGGFSSMTMTGSVTRNDHAFLMACTQAPNHRYNMVHRLKERLFTGVPEEENAYVLSSQEFADGTREEGFRYLSSFTYEDTPVWKFLVNGVEWPRARTRRHFLTVLTTAAADHAGWRLPPFSSLFPREAIWKRRRS